MRVLGIETVDTAGYSKRESHGRKETDGANAKRKHLRKISLGNEKGR